MWQLGSTYAKLFKPINFNVFIYFVSIIHMLNGFLVAQVVRHFLPTTSGVLISLLDHSIWVLWCTKQGLIGFSQGFSHFPLPQISFHHFFTLIHFVSFHFISPCDGAIGMVGQHPCYSQTFNIGASSHLIPRPSPVSDMNWGCFYVFYLIRMLSMAVCVTDTYYSY